MPSTKLSFLFSLIVVFLAGCTEARVLMPTPNLYSGSDTKLFAELAPELVSTQVELFYITDRAPERDENGNLTYTKGH